MSDEQKPWEKEGADRNERLRQASGAVAIPSRLVSFLYTLMITELPPGKVESILRTALHDHGEAIVYSNGWVANYAANIAAELAPPAEKT